MERENFAAYQPSAEAAKRYVTTTHNLKIPNHIKQEIAAYQPRAEAAQRTYLRRTT